MASFIFNIIAYDAFDTFEVKSPLAFIGKTSDIGLAKVETFLAHFTLVFVITYCTMCAFSIRCASVTVVVWTWQACSIVKVTL